MTDAGDRLIDGAAEALEIAQGVRPAAVLHIDGWDYVPRRDLLRQTDAATVLVAKAHMLVEMLDDAEVNHGGLWSGKTMRARDDLRQELSKWPK